MTNTPDQTPIEPSVSRVLSWFSCGAASAVATKLAVSKFGVGRVVPTYCETGAEHDDNKRFADDCSRWFSIEITRIKSTEFVDTWDIWERRKYLAGISGAPCTVELKVKPRLDFQKPNDIHVFGYTADSADISRAIRLRENYPELTIETPLIEAGLNKEACLSMIERAGIAVPVLYGMGFQNNNCLPCVKATSAAYWALIRKNFPDKFNRMAELAHRLDVRLCRIAGERAFIDEIPLDHPTTNPMQPSCDFLCHLAEQDME